MKRFLIALPLFALSWVLMAQQVNYNGEFVVEIRQINQRTSAVITGYNGASRHVYIPEQVGGYPVAAIGDNAFRGRQIEKVIFPLTLVSIGNYAFYGNKLSDINLPPSVVSVGTGAFDNNLVASGYPPAKAAPAAPFRSFTIEPAHSETFYVQKEKTPAQSSPIIITPGYNPIGPQQWTTPTGIVIPQNTAPLVPSHQAVSPSGAVTMRGALPPTSPNAPYTGNAAVPPNSAPVYPPFTPAQVQIVPAQSVQSERVGSGSGVRLVEQRSIDLYSGEEALADPGPTQPVYGLQKKDITTVWQTPRAR